MPMIRDTAQRRAIRKVIDESDRPLSPEEILSKAQRIVPNLGMATVYRSVKSLVEEEWLVPVDVPGEAQRYEQAGKAHHHHFNCKVCGRVYDLDGCPGGLENLIPPGYTMESHEIFLYGTCARCH